MLYIQSSNEVIKEERKSAQYFALTIKFRFKGNKMILSLDLDLDFYFLFTPVFKKKTPLGPWILFAWKELAGP